MVTHDNCESSLVDVVANKSKIAIVAALEREVHPIIQDWHTSERRHEGRDYKFYESGNTVLVCGGIGVECARRATEAVIACYGPEMVLSAGFAGALDDRLGVADIIRPSRIVDAGDGSVTELAGEGTLVTVLLIAGPSQKSKLARAYNAQAVDMEAAAVARGADARGVRFAALKVISDANHFPMPPMERFVTHDGQFRSTKFLIFVALRPWLWANVIRLAQNSSRAAKALGRALEAWLRHPESLDDSAAEWHPMKRAKV
jgi:adenosylhomocysteine nucleosidase